MKRNILVIGPSIKQSKGGMATVIDGIMNDQMLNSENNIDFHESFIDGNIVSRLLFSLKAYIQFRAIYSKYDIFHIHVASYGSTFRKGYYVNFLNKKNKKIVLHVHGAAYVKFYNELNEKKKKKVYEIWDKCDCVIALSEKWKSNFERIFNHKNIVVINNGIDTEQYEDAKSIENKNNFLFLGRIGKRKGAYDLVSAVEQIAKKQPSVLVYMAGDGEINQIKEIINKKNLNNNVKVVGWIDFETKVKLLREVGTVVLPSYNEGLPMALLEGMAAGKVVISTNVGGIPELVENETNGFIINPGDVEALVDRMIRVMTDEKFIENVSENNLRKIEDFFSRKEMHKNINRVFNSF